jgi:hypothetical protein
MKNNNQSIIDEKLQRFADVKTAMPELRITDLFFDRR